MTSDEVRALYNQMRNRAFPYEQVCTTCGYDWDSHIGLHCPIFLPGSSSKTPASTIFAPPATNPYTHTTLAALAGRQQPTPTPAPPTSVDISQWQAWRRRGEANECPCGGVRGKCPYHP